jgi:hypothetical protein
VSEGKRGWNLEMSSRVALSFNKTSNIGIVKTVGLKIWRGFLDRSRCRLLSNPNIYGEKNVGEVDPTRIAWQWRNGEILLLSVG